MQPGFAAAHRPGQLGANTSRLPLEHLHVGADGEIGIEGVHARDPAIEVSEEIGL